MRRRICWLAGMMVLLAGCKKYDGPALTGQEMEAACESIFYEITEVEEGMTPGTLAYTIELENDSEYDLVEAQFTLVYQVLIPEKEVEYSGGEHYPKDNPFTVSAGETRSFSVAVPAYDPDSREGEQVLLKIRGYLECERPENLVLLSKTRKMDE